jgi:glycosyltransferase involved in cell wall biosynthesis
VHHGGGTAPLRTRRPYVLTLHDLQFLTYPDYFSGIKRAYLSTVIPRSVRRASVVAVPSEFVRTSVIDEYGVEPDAVMVVPNGVEPALSIDVTPADVLRRRYDLGNGPVVVYPAMTHPHKNHRFLLELLAGPWSDPDLRLVLTGGAGSAEADVAGAADSRVRRVGRVPDPDRNGLLAMAEAMVFPSKYEGFGAPLIEAMALGAPVVCADTACIPEVVGDAALVLPLRVDAWAGALRDVAAHRDELVAAGTRRAAGFTSAASGAALSSVYERALGV